MLGLPSLRRKQLPFEDMTDVTQLILTPEQYGIFRDKLYWSFASGIEEGGYVTVTKDGNVSKMIDFYSFPNKFKFPNSIDVPEVEDSEFHENLMEELLESGEKIGFYYHTHSSTTHGLEIHEEYKTKSRTKDDLLERIEPDKTKKKLYAATRKVGDIIIEMLDIEEIHLHGYTPTSESYREVNPSSGFYRTRITHSLNIVVPELGLDYRSVVDKPVNPAVSN